MIHEGGYDGTVRWAGAALNSRKLVVDLTRPPENAPPVERVAVSPPPGAEIPFMLVEGLNHATILRKPEELIEPVLDALKVDSGEAYRAWTDSYSGASDTARWQQFVVRVVDERGDPVSDYYIAMGTGQGTKFEPLDDFSMDVHTYGDDPSYRCFHVNLDAVKAVRGKDLQQSRAQPAVRPEPPGPPDAPHPLRGRIAHARRSSPGNTHNTTRKPPPATIAA